MAHVSDPSFGDVTTADVTLQVSSSSTEHDHLSLHVHSKVLTRRSKYFEAWLSKRWTEDDTRPIVLNTIKKSAAVYKRCIELMYVPYEEMHSCFTSVNDALNTLEQAAELLFHDCLNACMSFLQTVPWSQEDEIAIRSCLACLDLEITRDLADRLFNVPGCKLTEVMKDLLGELLVVTSKTVTVSKTLKITETVLRKNIASPVNPLFASVNEVVLYKEWHNILKLVRNRVKESLNSEELVRNRVKESLKTEKLVMNLVKESLNSEKLVRNLVNESLNSEKAHQLDSLISATSTLNWLLDELLFQKIADVAVKRFIEDEELPNIYEIRDSAITYNFCTVLDRILLAFNRGEVILSSSLRFALLKHWLHVPQSRYNKRGANGNGPESFRGLMERFPMAEQVELFKIWIHRVKAGSPSPDLTALFEAFWDKLRRAQEWQDTKELEQSSAEEKLASMDK